MKYRAIHITGASGSGTTTLARRICETYGYVHFDTDDFFWEPSDPPYTRKRAIAERQRLLANALDGACAWALSGSLTDWGDLFIPRFDLVIYVSAPVEVRLRRLRAREHEQFGARILPGGDMFEEHQAFLDWAMQYDTGGMDMRSEAMHRAWLKQLPCPVIRADGTVPPEENLLLLND